MAQYLFLPVIPSPLLQSCAALRGWEVEFTAFANSVVLHEYSLSFGLGGWEAVLKVH